MSNDENDMTNDNDVITTKIYYNDRWQELLWWKTMRMMYDRQEWLQKQWNFLKTKMIMIIAMTNKQYFSKKIVCNADAMKSLCAFQLLFYPVEMLCCMIRDDEMKLCDKNMLECDDEVSLITCNSYDQSEVSV